MQSAAARVDHHDLGRMVLVKQGPHGGKRARLAAKADDDRGAVRSRDVTLVDRGTRRGKGAPLRIGGGLHGRHD